MFTMVLSGMKPGHKITYLIRLKLLNIPTTVHKNLQWKTVWKKPDENLKNCVHWEVECWVT